MSRVPLSVLNLVSGVTAFDDVFEALEQEWAPDPPGLTTSMGAVGRALAERAAGLDIVDVKAVLNRVESILREGTEEEKDAAATGFLEAVASVLDSFPERKWVLDHAGEESRRYLAAWDRFCRADGTS